MGLCRGGPQIQLEAHQLDMSTVRLLEVRNEENSYRLSEEPVFELLKNASD